VLIHQYGPHIFHTNSDEIVDYLSQLHRVAALRAQGARPGARAAGADPDQPHDAQQAVRPRSQDRRGSRGLSRLARRAGGEIKTSEDVVINAVGRELYELFFQGYTRKQWGIDPSGSTRR
jgi:UDP-galactopyranose mutase